MTLFSLIKNQFVTTRKGVRNILNRWKLLYYITNTIKDFKNTYKESTI